MTIDVLLVHLLALVFPAWVLSFLLSLIAAVVWRQGRLRLSFLANWAALGLTGSAVLLAGLMVFGEDGRILTYAILTLAVATVQWLVVRPAKLRK